MRWLIGGMLLVAALALVPGMAARIGSRLPRRG
jgi:hypothetical protein